MSFWRRKPGPAVTGGRIVHCAVGLVVPVIGSLFGYAAWCWCLAALALAVLWEVCSRWVGPALGWSHSWGDGLDLLAFIVGAAIGGSAGWLICR